MPICRFNFSCFLLTIALLLSASVQSEPKLKVADFVAEPAVFDAEFSPNGRYLAVISNSNGIRRLIIRDFESKGYPITGELSEKYIRPYSISWANNERLIVNLLFPSIPAKKILRKAKRDINFNIDDYKMYRRSVSIDIHAKELVALMEVKNSLRSNNDLSRITNFLPDDDEHVIMPAFGPEQS